MKSNDSLMILNVFVHFACFLVCPLHKLLQVVIAWLVNAGYSKSELLVGGGHIVLKLLEGMLVNFECTRVVLINPA